MRNIVQMHEDIKKKIDFVNNPRHESRAYDNAINEGIEQLINDRYDNIKNRKPYSVESIQRVKDELYTLVISSVLTVVSDVAALPSDYKHTLMVKAVINGVEQVVQPVPFDQLQERIDNVFTEPNAENPIYTQDSSGLTLYYGSNNTLGDVTLIYMKTPAVVTRGLPDEEIPAGTGVLTNATDYIVIEDETIHDSVTYYTGEIFTSANTDLTAGTVVLRSNTTDCDLPSTSHKEVIDKAAAIIEGWVDEFPSKQSLEFDASQS